MTKKEASVSFLERIKAVKAKRPRVVLEHILKHGFVTTEDLKSKYGYDHPPRAARDVHELGIPLEKFRIKSSTGRSIAAYRFGDPAKIYGGKLGARKVFSKQFKTMLVKTLEGRCTISREHYDERYLRVDHRIPYEISGEPKGIKRDIADYMLLCGSCNRAKSWSCEHCINWQDLRDVSVCRACYWAYPESYKHIALRNIRRLEVVWTEDEVAVYEALAKRANAASSEMPDYVKKVLEAHIR